MENNNEANNNIDLTLRLSLPFYDRLRIEENNRRQQGQGNFPIQFGAPVGRADLAPNHDLPAAAPLMDGVKRCQLCARTTTSLWRRGPNGPQTLCNACGLRYSRNMRRNVQG
ncbi:GATA transcription factor 20-like [Primulina huaijiensis]|uniref:GATA transcription factor 20-like n=1 Tax=Primulina huaijiensis TaxID=1492673 RepID=UPI003CC7904D